MRTLKITGLILAGMLAIAPVASAHGFAGGGGFHGGGGASVEVISQVGIMVDGMALGMVGAGTEDRIGGGLPWLLWL